MANKMQMNRDVENLRAEVKSLNLVILRQEREISRLETVRYECHKAAIAYEKRVAKTRAFAALCAAASFASLLTVGALIFGG